MHLELLLRYPMPPDAVAALLADRSFVEELCAASAAEAWTVDVAGAGAEAFTVTTDRTLPTTDFPDAVRRFVGHSLRVRQVDTWQAPAADGSRTGTTSVEVHGAPVSATATTSLRPAGGGTEQPVEGQVRASIPLLGARVEKAAAPALLAALQQQERLAAQRLR